MTRPTQWMKPAHLALFFLVNDATTAHAVWHGPQRRLRGAEARAPQAASASVPTYTAWERVWDSRSLRHSSICTDTTDRSLIARVCWHAPAGWALHQFLEAVRPANAVLLPGLPACGVLALEPVLPPRLRVTPEAVFWEFENPDNPLTAQPETLTLTLAIPWHCGWGTWWAYATGEGAGTSGRGGMPRRDPGRHAGDA